MGEKGETGEEKPPGPIVKLLMKLDPGIFYWVTLLLKFLARAADAVLDPVLGFTLTHGTRGERDRAKVDPKRCSIYRNLTPFSTWHKKAIFSKGPPSWSRSCSEGPTPW